MLIIGIRHKINSELDARRSATFTRYLLHYLRMFAFIGVIIPLLVAIDYYCNRLTIEETVKNKYIIAPMYNKAEYHIFTDRHHILTENSFYENSIIGDNLTFNYTPIFKTVTNVSYSIDDSIFDYKLNSVYGWVSIIVLITFVTSLIVLIKSWGRIKKQKLKKSDSLINIGIINAILCLMTLVAVLFRVLY